MDGEEITGDQKQRAEANRLAALAKRKCGVVVEAADNTTAVYPWKLFKCRKIVSSLPLQERFLARLEICSPNSFSVTPLPLAGFAYLGEAVCLKNLCDCLSHLEESHYTQNVRGGQSCVYKLNEYDNVLKCLRSNKGIDIEEIPWRTFNVVERFSHSFTSGKWMPCKPEHLSVEEVEELIRDKIPGTLLNMLLPFQLDGVRFGLQRGGRCLIADEMGLGKTIQAIAIASCFINKGSILIVCPAILRFSWAEELEHWFCLPSDIHLVFCHQDNPANLEKFPKVVVTSYTMLHNLRKSFSKLEWAMLIVDECHHLRCTKKPNESGEVKTVLDLASNIKHVVMLSGTPSLSRPYDIFHQIHLLWPGLLGKNKYDYAKVYCDANFVHGPEKYSKDFTKGSRLEELNVLLTQTVMIRRLKDHVLAELPPKRRQIIALLLKRSDVVSARTVIGMGNSDNLCKNLVLEKPSDDNDGLLDNCECRTCSYNINQIIGVAKIAGFCEWLSLHPIMCRADGTESLDMHTECNKMIVFCHHHKVLDGVQEFIAGKGVGFIRIDGRTLAGERQSALNSFRSSSMEVKIAIIGLTVASVGIDLSIAQHVVFLELPDDQATMLQAEDRAHRLGQKKAVNIYVFCAKDTSDERHWQNLSRSLQLVSSVMNGKNETLHEIEVDEVKRFVHASCHVDKDHETISFSSPNEYMKSQEVYSSSCDSLDATSLSGSETEVRLQISPNEIGGEEAVENTIMELTKSPVLDKIRTEMYNSSKARTLRFEVSRYTRRIHLHACSSGMEYRPSPLFRNFRPEEVELLESCGSFKEKMNVEYIHDNPWCKEPLLAFVSEWNCLRRVDQRKLFGKPLQLPLSVELSCLDETANHNSKGLLRGGSNKRRTSLAEISHPLPQNAVWKKVRLHFDCRKKDKEYIQGWREGGEGEPLCKLCQEPCGGVNAKMPEFFEDLFCKLGCYEEYRFRTSAKFLRKELFKIEFGVCTVCKLDCHKLVQQIKCLPLSKRQRHVEKAAPAIAKRKKLLDRLVNDAVEGNAWHADHIIPVYRGGGECTLDNMRTLCVSCHADVTANQRGELNSLRADSKKRLRALMLHLKNNGLNEDDDGAYLDERGSGSDDHLLVEVPGSSYSCPHDAIVVVAPTSHHT